MGHLVIRLSLGSSRRRLQKKYNAYSVLQVTDDQCGAEASKTKRGTNAMMDFDFELGRGSGISDKLSVCSPTFNTEQMPLLSTGRPWQSVLIAASAARTRSPAVAEAIDDHGKLPKGVAPRPGIKIMFGDSFAPGRQKVRRHGDEAICPKPSRPVSDGRRRRRGARLDGEPVPGSRGSVVGQRGGDGCRVLHAKRRRRRRSACGR